MQTTCPSARRPSSVSVEPSSRTTSARADGTIVPSRQPLAYCAQAAQAVRGMAAHLGAHEQLGHALGVGRARAHALGDVAREAQRLRGGELRFTRVHS